jgi:hypothetical protein
MTKKRVYSYPAASELTVVIRGAHERTEELCTQIIAAQLPSRDQLTVLHRSPFSEAVNQTFEIGIDSKRPWLIAIDADIIPLDDVVVRIREICGKMAPDAFVATPLFLCNAVGGLATRGLHCYKAEFIEEAYGLIATLEQNLRPESRIHDAMTARGYKRECYAKIFGLHEYEQSAKHIYLKSMLRSRKDEFREQIRENLESRADLCSDSRIALWGFEDSTADLTLGSPLPVEYDWDAHYPRFDERMGMMGWSEKQSVNLTDFDGYALKQIRNHDFLNDVQTLPWIREILDFQQGASAALEYVNTEPILEQPHQSPPPLCTESP